MRWTVAILGLAFLAASACDAGDPTTAETEEGAGLETADDPGDPGDPASDNPICDCQTYDCVVQSVLDEFGCDICVSWDCASGPVHGCALCDRSGDDRAAFAEDGDRMATWDPSP